MSFYPPAVDARAASPKLAGKAKGPNAIGTSASFECGSFVRFSLRIDRESLTIREAKYQTNGCGYAVASADRIAETVTDKRLTELHGLSDGELEAAIIEAFGIISTERRQCLRIGFEALRAALSDFRALQIEEFAGEKALICTCFGISEDAIERVIGENSLKTVSDVTAITNAGGGCGSCRMLIQELIDINRSQA